MFDSLPDKGDYILAQNSPAMIMAAVVLAAFGGGVMIGIAIGHHFSNLIGALGGVAWLGIAVWYARLLLRRVRQTRKES